MISIGVIDDTADWRGSIKSRIEQVLALQGTTGVSVVAREPLPNVSDYSQWIQTEGICALLIDERLSDHPLASGESCGYEGHDMAATLRQSADTIPIFVVTSARVNSDELNENTGLFENILEKDRFEERIEGYVQRILRSARRYSEETQALYAELSEVAQRVALGTATGTDQDRLKTLQEILQLRVNSDEMVTRSEMLSELQQKIAELESAMAEAKRFLA